MEAEEERGACAPGLFSACGLQCSGLTSARCLRWPFAIGCSAYLVAVPTAVRALVGALISCGTLSFENLCVSVAYVSLQGLFEQMAQL